MRSLIIIISIFLGLCFSKKPADYRDVVCGNYACQRTHSYANSDLTGMINANNSVTLTVSKSEVDSFVIINTSEGTLSFKFYNGKISVNDKRFFGHFSNDSVYLIYIPSLGPTSFRYIGKK